MILAWSATEVVRYSFYACNLLGSEPPFLLYLRYTTFYVLYPLGASSEAFLMYATLPSASPLAAPQAWQLSDYLRAVMFAIWWPGMLMCKWTFYSWLMLFVGLYVMYTYMIEQRHKVLGKGPVKPKGE